MGNVKKAQENEFQGAVTDFVSPRDLLGYPKSVISWQMAVAKMEQTFPVMRVRALHERAKPGEPFSVAGCNRSRPLEGAFHK